MCRFAASFFTYIFFFSRISSILVVFFCVCSAVLCVNGERLRSQAKSHKTHSSNPQSHSSWVIYLTLSVMDKYYVAPNALDPALAEALQRQQQLQQKQMATDTTTATVCVCVCGGKKHREDKIFGNPEAYRPLHVKLEFLVSLHENCLEIDFVSVPHRTQVNCNAVAFHHCSNRANLHTHLSYCIHTY